MTVIAMGGRRLLGGILAAAGLTWGVSALAQNNPGGPPDQAGTAKNIPSQTGAPGTFNAQTGTASSSGTGGAGAAQQGESGSALSSSPQAGTPGTPGTSSR